MNSGQPRDLLPRTGVAFLGLGAMGAPMAENLIRRGHALTVWNRSVKKSSAFEGRARIASSPSDAVRDAEIVVLMLADPAAVHAVVDAMLPALVRNALVIDMSTVDPETTRACSAKVHAAGADYFDAPVSGSVVPAKSGKLVILAGGAIAQIDRARTVLEAMGEVRRVGDVGQGMAMKLVLNALGAHMLTGFTAALAFGRKQGLDLRIMLDAISAGAFSSPLFASKGERIARGEFTPDCTLALMLKDQELVMKTAAALDYPMPTERAIRDVLVQAMAAGLGDDDIIGLTRLFEKWAALP